MSVMTATVERKQKIRKPLPVSKSSTNGPVPSSMEVPLDPFRYGFRYIENVDDQGSVKWIQIPLTLDDVLHPEVGDFIAKSSVHGSVCDYVKNTCKQQTRNRPGTITLHNVRVDLNLPGVKPVGPDIALFFDVKGKKDWYTFKVAEEGGPPVVIFEVTLPSTRHQDFGKKKDYYEQAGVPIYVIIDKLKIQDDKDERIDFQLHGFTLLNGCYVDMKPDEQGWLWIAPLQSWLEANGPEIRFYYSDGKPILDYEELIKQRDAAVDAKQVAEEIAQAAEACVQQPEDTRRAMEAELSRLRAMLKNQNE